MDFWRDLPTGPAAPERIYAVVECPKGTENKYQYDISKKAFVLDRVLFSAVHYPGDYGFIPQTFDEDGDPLDILVLVTNPTFPGCIITVRPIGVLRMEDQSLRDDKVLAVPVGDPRFNEYHSLNNPPEHILREIAYMFATYKGPEGKEVKVQGWGDAEGAREIIEECHQRFQKLPNNER